MQIRDEKTLTTEKDLLAKIADHNEGAFRIVYDNYKKHIYHYAKSLLHSEVQAEEVMQEVFVKIWTMGSGLKSINNLEAFLKILTRNRCLDLFRKLAAEGRLGKVTAVNYSEGHNETEEAVLLNDTRKLLNDAIQSLPKQQRDVYLLCQEEGLTYEEAAQKLDISINTVKTHMKRAVSSIRMKMRDYNDLVIVLIIADLVLFS